MNNYEKVLSLPVSTIFQFDEGTPWMRTKVGMMDLIPFIATTPLADGPIPDNLSDKFHTIKILYNPNSTNTKWDIIV